MSAPRVLVTGGAGFVGSHLVDALLARGDRVRILDSLDPQAHEGGVPRFLSADAELCRGDLCDSGAVGAALEDVEVVFHLGAMVGNGQSMYAPARYIEANVLGTAVLMEQVVARRHRVRRVVVASSMVVYGEGAYRCAEHGAVAPEARAEADLRRRRWEPRCPRCGEDIVPVPTREDAPLRATSPYGVSKRATEELALVTAGAFGVETVALRYLNVYGPRQALSNPYTGVAAIFCSRILSGRRPLVFEDGAQRRDLTHVSDIVRATLLAAEAPQAASRAINVGTGTAITVSQLASILARELGRADLEPEVGGEFRSGDIRHCVADLGLAQDVLGYAPQADRALALRDLAAWVATQTPTDRSDSATAELRALGLVG